MRFNLSKDIKRGDYLIGDTFSAFEVKRRPVPQPKITKPQPSPKPKKPPLLDTSNLAEIAKRLDQAKKRLEEIASMVRR